MIKMFKSGEILAAQKRPSRKIRPPLKNLELYMSRWKPFFSNLNPLELFWPKESKKKHIYAYNPGKGLINRLYGD